MVKTLLSDSRTRRVMLVSVAAWLLLGWFYGDDWLWTLLRAFGGTLVVVGISALYLSSSALARVSRVTLGVLLGGSCAYVLGGGPYAVMAAASFFAAVLVAIEYVIQRDLNRRSVSG